MLGEDVKYLSQNESIFALMS